MSQKLTCVNGKNRNMHIYCGYPLLPSVGLYRPFEQLLMSADCRSQKKMGIAWFEGTLQDDIPWASCYEIYYTHNNIYILGPSKVPCYLQTGVFGRNLSQRRHSVALWPASGKFGQKPESGSRSLWREHCYGERAIHERLPLLRIRLEKLYRHSRYSIGFIALSYSKFCTFGFGPPPSPRKNPITRNGLNSLQKKECWQKKYGRGLVYMNELRMTTYISQLLRARF